MGLLLCEPDLEYSRFTTPFDALIPYEVPLYLDASPSDGKPDQMSAHAYLPVGVLRTFGT